MNVTAEDGNPWNFPPKTFRIIILEYVLPKAVKDYDMENKEEYRFDTYFSSRVVYFVEEEFMVLLETMEKLVD